MWMHPRPSCSNRSISTMLDNAEIYTWVQRILALEAHRNSGPSLIPLGEGVDIRWVIPLELASAQLCQFLPFLLWLLLSCARYWVHAWRPTGGGGGTLSQGFSKVEANQAKNEGRHAQKQRRWPRNAARAATRARGEETASELKFSGVEDEEDDEDELEEEVISSPHAPSSKILPLPGELFGRQAAIPVSACLVKCPRADANGLSSLPPQFGLMLVCSVLLGTHICICWCRRDLLIRSPVGSLVFAGHRCHSARDCGVALIRHWGCGALAQECLSLVFPIGVFLIRMWC
jgi:hypothetical protein